MRVQFLIFSLLFVISTSCNSQVDNLSYSKLKKIKIKSEEQDNIASLVSNHKYIKLETNTECIISQIDKILYKFGKFYILDSESQALFIFSKEGKFLSKIARSGQGPGEYTYLMDFDVDSLGNIYLLDLNQKAILKFNEGGRFLIKYPKDHFISNIAVIDTSTLLTYQAAAVSSNITHKLTFHNSGKKIKSFLPLKQSQKISMLKPFPLTHSNNKIFYNGDLSDTIFSVSIDSLYANYFLDFGKYSIDPALRKDFDYFTKASSKVSQGWRINNCFETSNYFTCTYNLDNKTWSLYYSLADGKTLVSYCADCNEIPQKVINDFRAIGVYDDYFISYLKIHTIDRYKKDIAARPGRMKEIIGVENIDLLQSIDLSDNPVLVLYKMK